MTASKEEYECVGGPLNGRRLPVDPHVEFVEFPVVSPDMKAEFNKVHYRPDDPRRIEEMQRNFGGRIRYRADHSNRRLCFVP